MKDLQFDFSSFEFRLAVRPDLAEANGELGGADGDRAAEFTTCGMDPASQESMVAAANATMRSPVA